MIFLKFEALTRKLSNNLLFGQIFTENCMKLKEIGLGVHALLASRWIRQCVIIT